MLGYEVGQGYSRRKVHVAVSLYFTKTYGYVRVPRNYRATRYRLAKEHFIFIK